MRNSISLDAYNRSNYILKSTNCWPGIRISWVFFSKIDKRERCLFGTIYLVTYICFFLLNLKTIFSFQVSVDTLW